MTRRIVLVVSALALLGSGGPALAGFDLVLKDGVTIQADTVRRYGDKYEVRSWSGETMMVDASEIAQIRATEDPPAEGGSASQPAVANRVRSSPASTGGSGARSQPPNETPAARTEAPRRAEVDPHMRPSPAPAGSGGTILSGPEVRPPTVQESLDALGKPSEWSQPSIDPTWQPTDAFGR